MIIDTNKASGWIKTHLKISVPIATGFLSWWSAMRWQAAIDHNYTALCMFYFAVAAASGVVTLIMTVCHFRQLGFFDNE